MKVVLEMLRFSKLRSLAFFLLIPAFGFITPLIFLPVLTSRYGANGLAAFGVAQSFGAGGSTLAELGWIVVGPQMVARLDAQRRLILFEQCVASKLFAAALVAPIIALLAYLSIETYRVEAAVIAGATVLTSLSPAWYFIGINQPKLIIFSESLPRLVIAAISTYMIYAGGNMILYGVGVIFGSVLVYITTNLLVGASLFPTKSTLTSAFPVILSQLPVTFGRFVSVLYTSFSVAIFNIANPAATATFSAADRLARMSLSVLTAVPNRLQSWVASGEDIELEDRMDRSLKYNAATGFFSGTAFFIFVPLFVPFLFSNVVSLSMLTYALGGMLISVVCTSRGVGLALVAANRAGRIVVGNIAAAIIGGISIFIFGRYFGASGGICGAILAETSALIIQLWYLKHARTAKTMAQRHERVRM